MGRLSLVLQLAAHISTIIAGSLLCVVLVRTYRPYGPGLRRPARPDALGARVGETLSSRLHGVDWGGNHRTLILVLSTRCHFCSDSALFYRRVCDKTERKFKIVAVLPEPIKDAREYLNREGVRVDQVEHLSLDALGVSGTPTMLMVDDRGVGMKSWVGKLSGSDEQAAFRWILEA